MLSNKYNKQNCKYTYKRNRTKRKINKKNENVN